MDRRQFLKGIAVGAAAVSSAGCFDSFAMKQSPAKSPNIILIMIDDLGWMDLHCQGNDKLSTPNIDKLATQGMRFTDAYAAAPVCSPTRAAMMTGKSPARLGLTTHIPDRPDFAPKDAKIASADTLNFLSLEYTTIAERLKSAGYATAFMGKWHLSGRSKRGDKGKGSPEFEPQHQGYDINIGGCCYGGPPTFFDPYRIYNIPPRKEGEYLPDRFADEADAFIRSSTDKPFFLTLWNYTVHWPMEAPQDLIDKYQGKEGYGLKDPRYAAMIEAMDAAVGRLMDLLDELKLADDTLFIFTSDNGGFSGVADNRPLRDGKGTLYEGGIRVPLIVRMPGVVPPNTTCKIPVISMDMYPTLLEAADLEREGEDVLDGESIMSLLTGDGKLKRDAIYFHYPNYAWHGSNKLGGVIREGKFKLIERYEDGSVELYDLENDLSEKEDLSSKLPEVAKRLKGKLDTWLRKSGANMPKTT